MSSIHTIDGHALHTPDTAPVDQKLEVVIIPVSDVDRAKMFYEGLGWRLDADFANGDDWRLVQMTPPGSPCSVMFGRGRRERHGSCEPIAQKHHWSDWYGAYIVARERGSPLDDASTDAAINVERRRDRICG